MINSKQLTKEDKERLLLRTIFGNKALSCDCDMCQYLKECEIDNPDFDANYCKLS